MTEIKKGPFTQKLSFRLLQEAMEKRRNDKNKVVAQQAETVLQLFADHPKLITGFAPDEPIDDYQSVIDEVMAYLFPATLTTNEIKAAFMPFSNQIIYISERFRNIINTAKNDINQAFAEMFQVEQYSDFNFIPYAIILNKYYQYQVDFARPLHFKVQHQNGVVRTYRVLNNADFLDIYPNENAIEITPEIVAEILANAQDPAVWDKYFPKDSWTVEGFGIFNLVDITLDNQIDVFKSHLIEPNSDESFDKITNDIREVFGISDLLVGVYEVDGKTILPGQNKKSNSLTLHVNEGMKCSEYACPTLNQKLFEKYETVILSNVEMYHNKCGGSRLSEMLQEKDIHSVILIPILVEGELAFVLEIASQKQNQLNAVNALKLEKILPFIQSYAERVKDEYENQISAVIQRECTSIHPAVQWRFEQEAVKYIQNQNAGLRANFNEIVFENVTPLYGQIDIVGSSNARNEAIQKDLLTLLDESKKVLERFAADQKLPFYDQLIFQTEKFYEQVDYDFQSNTEQIISQFFDTQLYPIFTHIQQTQPNFKPVLDFLAQIDSTTNTIYQARKEYDNTVDSINKELSQFLDVKQQDAQAIFPHYFEKYKTDGIEHNLYVGQSISKNQVYHPSVMYNLRLWQLQVMCEMEAMYYQKQREFAVPLNVASLIFAYDTPITIRYRIDEKKFDVDGAYNVRYEMIKKRIDKAHIKGTTERLTQPHKLAVVYSNPLMKREYLSYFEFLQSINYITKDIELVELEELQGASGMKAIRAEINHDLDKTEKVFSLEDLKWA